MAAAGTRAALAAERAERDALTLAAAALERALPELGSASSSAEGGSSSSLASRKGSGSSAPAASSHSSRVLGAAAARAASAVAGELRREEARLAFASEELMDSWAQGLAHASRVARGAAGFEAEVLTTLRDRVDETLQRATLGGDPRAGWALEHLAAARHNLGRVVGEAGELLATTESLARTADEMEVLAAKATMDFESTEASDALYELTGRTIKYLRASDMLGRVLERRARATDTSEAGLEGGDGPPALPSRRSESCILAAAEASTRDSLRASRPHTSDSAIINKPSGASSDDGSLRIARSQSGTARRRWAQVRKGSVSATLHREQRVALMKHHDVLNRARTSLDTAFEAVAMNADRLAHVSPEALVARARAVELLEHAVREHNAASEQGPSGTPAAVEDDEADVADLRRPAALVAAASPRERFICTMVDTAQEHARAVLSWEQGQDATVLLEAASTLVDRLHTVRSVFAPCFPREYDLLHRFAKMYHAEFVSLFELFAECARDGDDEGAAPGQTTDTNMLRKSHFVSNAAILDALRWVPEYEHTLQWRYHIDAAEELEPPLSEVASALLEQYVQRTRKALTTWAGNIARADQVLEPSADTNGRLVSPAFIDIMRLVSDQVDVVRELNGTLLLEVGVCGLDALMWFQQRQLEGALRPLAGLAGGTADVDIADGKEKDGDMPASRSQAELMELSLARMASLANSSLEAAAEMEPFSNSIASMLLLTPHALMAHNRLDAAAAARGFAETAAVAAERCADIVLHDIIAKLFPELFTDEWSAQNAADSVIAGIIATLKDYFDDLRVYLVPEAFTAMANATLEKVVTGYLGALLLGASTRVKPHWDAQAEADELHLAAFFSDIVEDEAMLDGVLLALKLTRALVFAPSNEDALEACVLLRAAHRVSDAMLERMLKVSIALGDSSAATRAEVLTAAAEAVSQPPLVAVCEEENGEMPTTATLQFDDATAAHGFQPFEILEEEAGGAARLRRARTIETAVTSASKSFQSQARPDRADKRWAISKAHASRLVTSKMIGDFEFEE